MLIQFLRTGLAGLLLLGAAGQIQATSDLPPETMHAAAETGNIAIMEALMAKDVSINKRDNRGMSPLLAALAKSQGKAANWLIEKGADIKAKDYSDRTVLYWAIRGKVPSLALDLLEKGADPNTTALGNETILDVAAVSGDVTIVNALLEKGVDTKAYKHLADSPIYNAAMQGHKAVVDRLSEHYPKDPHVLSFYGSPKQVDAALKAGNKSINAQIGYTKDTLLHCATYGNNTKLVSYLIKKGAALNKKDRYDATPLIVAAEKNKFKVIKLLLKAGADKEATNISGDTALHMAARRDSVKSAKALLKAGAFIHTKNKSKKTALDLAKEKEKSKLVKLLEKKNKSLDKWFTAAAKGNLAVIKKLKKKAFFLQAYDNKGWTALHHATKNRYKEIIPVLIEAGIEKDAINVDSDTALMMAVEDNDLEMVRFLCTQKVDMNRTNGVGLGPIHRAALTNKTEIVDALLTAGLPINKNDMHGYTAVDYAGRGKHKELVTKLKAKGGKPGSGLPPLIVHLHPGLARTYAIMGKKADRLNSMANEFIKNSKSRFSLNTGRQFSNQAGAFIRMQQGILNIAVRFNHLEDGSTVIPKVKKLAKELNKDLMQLRTTYPDFKRASQKIRSVSMKISDLEAEAQDTEN